MTKKRKQDHPYFNRYAEVFGHVNIKLDLIMFRG